jgi:GAF domain-containing protein
MAARGRAGDSAGVTASASPPEAAGEGAGVSGVGGARDPLSAAIEIVDHAPTVGAVLSSACRALAAVLGARAASISKLVGDVIVQIAEETPPGTTLVIGYGYLVSDYPLTAVVLERSEPRAVSVFDQDADPSEAALLRDLGYDALLMLPLEVGGREWGLVEIYDRGERRFRPQDAEAAARLVERTALRIDELHRRDPRDRRFGRVAP